MGVLDPSPFIDDPNPSGAWQGMGPMAAANGQLGALQQALVGRTEGGTAQALSPYTGRPAFTEDMGPEIQRALLTRIRSPEQLEQATQDRRGALAALQQAVSAPLNTRTFDSDFQEGMMNAPYGRSADNFRFGLAAAMKGQKEKEEQLAAGRIAAAKLGLDFQNSEEKNADNAEKSALSDSARVLSAQVHGPTAAQLSRMRGAINVPGVGLVDISQKDENGQVVPKVLLSPDNTQKYFAEGRKQGQILANHLASTGAFKNSGELTDFIENFANDYVQKQAGLQNPTTAGVNGRAISSQPADQPTVNGNPLISAMKSMESGGKQSAVSPKGAVGVMQVMKDTGPEAAAAAGLPWDADKWKNDAQYNEQIGTAYMNKMLQKYNGNEPYALAAYNMGPGATDEWISKGANPRKLPMETRLYISDVLASKAGQNTDPTAPNPIQAISNVNSTPIKSKSDMERETVFQRENEKGAADIVNTWRTQANQANDALNTVNNIMAMRDQFEPGKFAGAKEKLGGYMNALGLNGGAVNEARTIQQVQRMIQEQINNRMTLEKGVQTEGDAQRFAKAYASTLDTPGAFDFAMGMIKESALRNQERANLAEQYNTEKKSNVGVQKAWEDYRDGKLGPMLIGNYEGRPIWRHDFIDEAFTATKEANPSASDSAIMQAVQQKWLEVSKKLNKSGK